jgi:hypothetical protein
MVKILAASIVATFWGCSGSAEVELSGEPGSIGCEARVVLANPGPSEPEICFRAVAGANSCVRLPGGECGPSVEVRLGESYEALSCEDSWGAPTLEACGAGTVLQ